MGEVTNLASRGVRLVPPEMSTYFRALLLKISTGISVLEGV